MTAPRSSDLARRVAQRRQELGLTREEVAQRSDMDPTYLEYLERSPAVALSRGALIRLAVALETSVEYLRGGEADRPPGPGRPGPHPHLDALSEAECRAHLAAGGVGRFVFLNAQTPIALPVNFQLFEGDIVFRTCSGGALTKAAGTPVGFEVDRIDDAMSEGWSVLITGTARLVDDPAELSQLENLGIDPWPGGHREAFMRIETATISGRHIRQGSPSTQQSSKPKKPH